MGMFDDVRCEYPLPGDHHKLIGWQTKDTPTQFLDLYVIAADGRLLYEDYDAQDRSRCALAGHDKDKCEEHNSLDKLGGSWGKTNRRLVEVEPPFDGDLYFYGGQPFDGWLEYRATFRNGRVTEMTRMPDRFAEMRKAAQSEVGAEMSRDGRDGDANKNETEKSKENRSSEGGCMSEPRATFLAFEERYTDDSGVQYAVRYSENKGEPRIEFECIDSATFPLAKIVWLMDCLERIREETEGKL